MPSRSNGSLVALGILILVPLALLLVYIGGVAPRVQGIASGLVAVACAFAATLPPKKLAMCGITLRWLAAGALVVAGIAVGLTPLPSAVLGVVAPGSTAARPGLPWGTLATAVEPIYGEIATWTMVIGFGAAVATWGTIRHRRGETELILTVITGLVGLSAAAHAYLGATTMLGIASPNTLPPTWFAPFVNPDHAAAAMLLGGPVAVSVAMNPEQSSSARVLGVGVALLGLGLIAWTGCAGAAIAAGLVVVLWVARARGFGAWVFVLGVSGALALQVWVGRSATWVTGSAAVRAVLWRDSLRMAADYWLAGTGAGTYGEAVRGYRTDHLFLTFSHAHSEPIEWIAETGLVGLVALVGAGWVLLRGGVRDSPRTNGPLFAALGFAMHACVDFPLQIPALAFGAAALLALLVSVWGPHFPTRPGSVRAGLVVIALLQAPAAWLQFRSADVTDAVKAVMAWRKAPAPGDRAAKALVGLDAGEAERALYDAWQVEASRDTPAALAAAAALRDAYPDRPAVLAEAALIFARAKQYDEATAMLERVAARLPSESKPWVLLARVAHAAGDDKLAAKRYVEAFARGAEGLDEAYSMLPVGLYWLNRFDDADASYSGLLCHKLLDEGDLEVALLACEQAERMDPVGQRDQLVRSQVLRRLGRFDEDLAWLAEIVVRKPDDPMVLAEYAQVLTEAGRHEDAVAAWLSAARFDPRLRVQALRAAESAGGPRRALDLARRFETAGTVDDSLGLEIAAQHLRNGDARECLRSIERWNLLHGALAAQAADQLKQCKEASK